MAMSLVLTLRALAAVVVLPGTVAGWLPLLVVERDHHLAPAWPLAVPVVAAGLFTFAWTVWDFASRGRGTLAPFDPPRQLVVTGPHRCVRNPMYVGLLAIIVAEAIALGSATLAVYAGAVFAAFSTFVIAYEEPALRARFGAEYEDYCARVPRWFVHRVTP